MYSYPLPPILHSEQPSMKTYQSFLLGSWGISFGKFVAFVMKSMKALPLIFYLGRYSMSNSLNYMDQST